MRICTLFLVAAWFTSLRLRSCGENWGHLWPGTLVYVTLNLGAVADLNLQKMMVEFREAAASELAQARANDQKQRYYLNIRNYFGRYAEDKQLAIKLRDEKLLPVIEEGVVVTIDFEEVISAPPSSPTMRPR